MPSKLMVPALALFALLVLLPAGGLRAADEAPAGEVSLPDAGCADAVMSVEDPEWSSTLGEGPIGGLPVACPGATYQRRWVKIGCCPAYGGSVPEGKYMEEERFYCPDTGWSSWYFNYRTKCEGVCLG